MENGLEMAYQSVCSDSAEFEKQIRVAVEITTAPRNFDAFFEDDAVFAVKPGLEFLMLSTLTICERLARRNFDGSSF